MAILFAKSQRHRGGALLMLVDFIHPGAESAVEGDRKEGNLGLQCPPTGARHAVVLQGKWPAGCRLLTSIIRQTFLEREKGFEPSTSTLAKPQNGVSRRYWACQAAARTPGASRLQGIWFPVRNAEREPTLAMSGFAFAPARRQARLVQDLRPRWYSPNTSIH